MDTPRCEIVLPRAAYVVGAILLGGYVVYWLRDVLTPIFLAFSLAYLLDPLVDRLEAWRVPRPAGIAIVLVGTLGAVALFLGLVVPGVAADVAGVIRELPTQLAALWARIEPWLEQRGIEVPHSTTEWAERLGTYASDVAHDPGPAGNALSSLLGGTLSVLARPPPPSLCWCSGSTC